MWRVASSIPLDGLVLFFSVWLFVALIVIVKRRSDGHRVRASWFAYGIGAAAGAAFATCFALNYSSLHRTSEPPQLVDDDKTYRVYDMEKGGTEDLKGRDVKARYGSDVREDGTRVGDENRKTFGEQVMEIRAGAAETRR